jgi:hypothetical protein
MTTRQSSWKKTGAEGFFLLTGREVTIVSILDESRKMWSGTDMIE